MGIVNNNVEEKVRILAQTLKSSGLAASETEAMRMARDMTRTVAAVTRNFEERRDANIMGLSNLKKAQPQTRQSGYNINVVRPQDFEQYRNPQTNQQQEQRQSYAQQAGFVEQSRQTQQNSQRTSTSTNLPTYDDYYGTKPTQSIQTNQSNTQSQYTQMNQQQNSVQSNAQPEIRIRDYDDTEFLNAGEELLDQNILVENAVTEQPAPTMQDIPTGNNIIEEDPQNYAHEEDNFDQIQDMNISEAIKPQNIQENVGQPQSVGNQSQSSQPLQAQSRPPAEEEKPKKDISHMEESRIDLGAVFKFKK